MSWDTSGLQCINKINLIMCLAGDSCHSTSVSRLVCYFCAENFLDRFSYAILLAYFLYPFLGVRRHCIRLGIRFHLFFVPWPTRSDTQNWF